jgi:pimeloyl-ACP methyl ester carboxylesterase
VRVDEHTIDLDGAPVFYRRAGEAPILYLHGTPTSSDDWLPFLERGGGVAPDLLGFGRSAKGGNLDYSIEGQARFIESLLERLALGRITLIAHDWGAAGGLVFAQRHPERIERLVLINALPLLEGFRWHRLARVWRTPVLGELVMGSTTRWVLARELARGGASPDARTTWEQFDQGTQRAILRQHRSADEQALAAAGAGLASLSMPARVVWGERDPWLDARFADAYGKVLPNATVQRIADAGHWPWLDRPELVDRLLA